MRRKRNEAHRALGLDRPDSLDDARRRRASDLRATAQGDEVAVRASPAMPGGTRYSRPTARFSTGNARPEPRPTRDRRRSARLHLLEDLDHPAGIGGRLDPRQRRTRPASKPGPQGRGRSAIALCARTAHKDARRRPSRVHSTGWRSVRRRAARSAISATMREGSRPWTVSAFRPCATAPSA